MLSHNLWKKERKKEMEVEGNRQEIQQIQPAAKKTESILINIVCL